jgi:hypothetical protein
MKKLLPLFLVVLLVALAVPAGQDLSIVNPGNVTLRLG